MLVHAFPDADIPVVQLSINATKPFEYHLELGSDARAAARHEACSSWAAATWCTTSRRIDWSQPDAGFDWARRFDDDAASIMTSAPADIASLERHELYDLAAPTPEHFIPLLYIAGLASAADQTSPRARRRLRNGIAVDGLLHARRRSSSSPTATGGAPPLPDVQADETNI